MSATPDDGEAREEEQDDQNVVFAICLHRKDVRLPVKMQRVMAAEAEATREARAKVSWLFVRHMGHAYYSKTHSPVLCYVLGDSSFCVRASVRTQLV